MKRFITTGIAAAMVVLLASCAQPTDATPMSNTEGSGFTVQQDTAAEQAPVIGTSGIEPAAAGNNSPREGLLGAAQAQDLILERLGNPDDAEFIRFQLDDADSNDAEYEGKVKVGNDVYEFEMKARSGRITELEKEGARVQVTTPAETRVTESSDTAETTATTEGTTPAAREFIGADRAKAIALAKVSGATVDHIHDFELDDNDTDRDDRPEYEGEIKYDGYEYEFEIDAYTGEITEWEVERDGRSRQTSAATVTEATTTAPATTQAATTPQTTATTEATTPAARQFIGSDRAKAIALAKVPGATVDHIHDFELDDEDDDRDDRPEYEGEIKYDGYEYEFEIDAYTGEITEWEVERDGRSRQTSATTVTEAATAAPATTQAATAPQTTAATARQFIGADRAKAIALAKVPGATVDHIHDFELDDEDDDRDDRPEYEGEIKYDGYEYEFEIDAYTGEITDWDVERDGRSHQTPATTKTPDTTQAPATTARQRISRDRAIQIALAQVPGATTKHVEDVEMDDDEIEIEIEYNNYEYEFEIHPWTGEILDMEVEYDD